MNNKPSHSIFSGVLTDSPVAADITAWFDEIYERYCTSISHNMYNLISFERCPDNLLDFFLFDKGFSTHVNLSAEAKRCILRNWEFIHHYRMTDGSIKKYLECILQVDVTLTSTYNPKKQFLQPNSTRFGFPNQASLNSFNTSNDLMVYIYSTDYEVEDILDIQLSATNTYTADLTDYVFEVLKFELPNTNFSHKLRVNLLDELSANIATKIL